MTDETWRERAACIGKPPRWFFASRPKATYKQGRQVCAECPVRLSCLSHALETREPDGLWGGLDVNQRDAIRRKRQRSARAS